MPHSYLLSSVGLHLALGLGDSLGLANSGALSSRVIVIPGKTPFQRA